MADQAPPAAGHAPDETPITDLSNADVVFGNRTIGWYKWAAWFSKKCFDSGLLPEQIKTPQQAFAILCKGDELGLPPFGAWQFIYLTKAKRLALLGKGALAVVQSKPMFESYSERIEREGTPEMAAVAIAKRKGMEAIVKTFSVADAEAARLLEKGKDYFGPWLGFLKDMLLSKARARALDIAFAAELGGIDLEGVAEDIAAAEERKAAVRAQPQARQQIREARRPALPPGTEIRDSLLDEVSKRPEMVAEPAKKEG